MLLSFHKSPGLAAPVVSRLLIHLALLLAVLGIVLAAAAGGASAATAGSRGWIATGWNIHLMNAAGPAAAAHFFNTPSSFAAGPGKTAAPVYDGYTTSPVLVYASYAQFSADIASGTITSAFKWVIYDSEYWPATPLSEQRDPGKYMKLFGNLAHAHGLKVIMTPARDLGNVARTVLARQGSETLNQWYLRCNLAGLAAAAGDTVVVQDQVNTTSPGTYASLFNIARQQAVTANPGVAVYGEVSMSYGTPAQMAAAAQSVSAAGYYVSISEPLLARANQFFALMQAAGY